MDDRDKADSVQLGDRVYIYYEDVPRGIEGIVSHIHDRKLGTISVRFLTRDLPPEDRWRFLTVQKGKYVPLVLQYHEWELKKKGKIIL